MQGVRSGKLKLKGAKQRSSARVEKPRHLSAPQSTKKVSEASETLPLWIDLGEAEDLNGPTLLMSKAPEAAFLLVVSEEGVPLFKSLLELQISIDHPEPTDSSQVFVARSIVKGKFTFKTALGRYLSSDSLGKVTASRSAVGPSEEWALKRVDGGFALENYLGHYLSMDSSTGRARADSKEVDCQEILQLRCQSTEIVRSASTKDEGRQQHSLLANLDDLEVKESRKYVSWGAKKKPNHSNEHQDDLRTAQASGRLHETLLERRMRSKHDPFC